MWPPADSHEAKWMVHGTTSPCSHRLFPTMPWLACHLPAHPAQHSAYLSSAVRHPSPRARCVYSRTVPVLSAWASWSLQRLMRLVWTTSNCPGFFSCGRGATWVHSSPIGTLTWAAASFPRAFPPKSGHRHIGHTLQKRVSNLFCALIGPPRFHEVKWVTCGMSYCPQIAQFIIFLFRQPPTDGIWYLSELDGRVPSRLQSPDRWSVSRISRAVACGRTRLRACRTRGPIAATMAEQLDRSACAGTRGGAGPRSRARSPNGRTCGHVVNWAEPSTHDSTPGRPWQPPHPHS